jgi:hypothetical protein
MASRNAQTMAKRAREQAVKERRDRKRAKKAAVAADRAAGHEAPVVGISSGDDIGATVAPEPTPPRQT